MRHHFIYMRRNILKLKWNITNVDEDVGKLGCTWLYMVVGM